MRALVIGANGMLGSDAVDELHLRGHESTSVDLPEFDASDPACVARIAAGEFGRLDWVLNCSGYTAVDRAEDEKRLAMEVNGLAPGYLAEACAMAGSKLIHISTDFVFDGEATSPYGEDAQPRPLSVYGRSKLAGENALVGSPIALIVRTSWLFGPRGASFPTTILAAWKEGKSLRIVGDQVSKPTYTADLSRVLVDLAEMDPFPGIYHAAGPEVMSWFDLAERAIRVCEHAEPNIERISTDQYPTAAKRPAYSVLDCTKIRELGIKPMRPIDEALADFCRRRRAQEAS